MTKEKEQEIETLQEQVNNLTSQRHQQLDSLQKKVDQLTTENHQLQKQLENGQLEMCKCGLLL